jgi:plasmid maintenance system antidote protein VapI
MKGPFQMQTWREALEEDAAAQQLLAERDRLTADIAKSRSEAVAADQETWLVEQERLAYQSAHAYQQQQIRSAIESKVSEVQHQVLNLLYRNLKKLSDKDYQPGKIPPGLKHQLEELTESASILSYTDQSLAQVVEGLSQVNATACIPQAEQDTLRGQVNELLNQLESRLRVPELEVVESLGSDDRATWLKWG